MLLTTPSKNLEELPEKLVVVSDAVGKITLY